MAPGAPTWHPGPGRSGQRPAAPGSGTYLSVDVASPPWYTYRVWHHLVLDNVVSHPEGHPVDCVRKNRRVGRLQRLRAL